MVIVENPQAGGYRVRVRGTASGAFALGTLAIDSGTEAPAAPAVLGEAAPPTAATSPTATVVGTVASETELVYTVLYRGAGVTPDIAFDTAATAQNAVERISAATRAIEPETTPALLTTEAVVSAAEPPSDLREALVAVLGGEEPAALERVAERIGGPHPDAQAAASLIHAVAQLVGPRDPALAAGLIEQIRQAVGAGTGSG
jgi:hypothetical protein